MLGRMPGYAVPPDGSVFSGLLQPYELEPRVQPPARSPAAAGHSCWPAEPPLPPAAAAYAAPPSGWDELRLHLGPVPDSFSSRCSVAEPHAGLLPPSATKLESMALASSGRTARASSGGPENRTDNADAPPAAAVSAASMFSPPLPLPPPALSHRTASPALCTDVKMEASPPAGVFLHPPMPFGSSGSLTGSGALSTSGGAAGVSLSSSAGGSKRSRSTAEEDDDPRCDILNLFDAYKAKSWVTLEELREFFVAVRTNRADSVTPFTLPQMIRINDSLAYFFHENGNNKSYGPDKRIVLPDLRRFCKYFCCKGPEYCLDQLLDVFETAYFHGFLGGSEALALCQNARKLQKTNGQYLLRFSMTRDFRNCGYFGFTALRSDKSGKEEEYNVLVGFDVGKNAWVINPHGSEHTSSYPTLHDIVAYNATVLRYPVERSGSKLSSMAYMTRNSALDDLTAATMNMSIDALPVPNPQLPDVSAGSRQAPRPPSVPPMLSPRPLPNAQDSASVGASTLSGAVAGNTPKESVSLTGPSTPPSPPLQTPMSPGSPPLLDSALPAGPRTFPATLTVNYTAKTGKETQKTFKISSMLTAEEVLKQLAGTKAGQYELQDADGSVVLGRLAEAFDGLTSALAFLREKEELDL
eukprot:TRINITY_DN2418_c0_g1_i4.p1 TRINITY_DN2418_c0_g1~~TRINITY_DN2418_c0_g1_i4.p1  ORF type:complete len:640 (+),score=286.56 TRINITY_DN2418_c0_g1_i4:155-2074(+)